jgi:hypothetical protein
VLNPSRITGIVRLLLASIGEHVCVWRGLGGGEVHHEGGGQLAGGLLTLTLHDGV